MTCERIAANLAKAALGQSAAQYRSIARLFQDMAAPHPAACCGLEAALLDALCRESGIPLWSFWGGAEVWERETDITIPITTVERTVALARNWYRNGFRLFKTKVGADVEQDIQRVEALCRTCADVAIIADANQGFTRAECLHFVNEVKRFGARILLLEQPVRREDMDGMAAVRRDAGVPVAADESVRSLQDAREIARADAADFINIKIMKTGLLQAMDIAAFARASGLRLMIGGMVETRIAMGCSFALVLGTGGFDILDLDTPLLLARDPIKGGYRYSGPVLHPWSGPGLDLETETDSRVTIIE